MFHSFMPNSMFLHQSYFVEKIEKFDVKIKTLQLDKF